MAGCRNRSGQFAHCATGQRAAGDPTYVKRFGVGTPVTVTSKWTEFQPGDAVFDSWRGHGTVLGKVPATKHEPAAVHIAWKDGTESWPQVGSAELERGLMKWQGQGAQGRQASWGKRYDAQDIAEMKTLLVRHGFDPKLVQRLQADGIGPLELADRLKFPPGAVGSLEFTHNFKRLRGSAARKFPKGGPCATYKTPAAKKKCRTRVSKKIGSGSV